MNIKTHPFVRSFAGYLDFVVILNTTVRSYWQCIGKDKAMFLGI
jgi:hypothetical protein